MKIQEIKIFDNVLFSIDSYGKINVQKIKSNLKTEIKIKQKKYTSLQCITFIPITIPSQTGINFSNNTISVFHHSENSLAWIDVKSGRTLRLVRTIKKPNGICNDRLFFKSFFCRIIFL